MSKTLLGNREQSTSSLSSRELSDLVWKFNNLNSTAKMLLLGTNSQSVPFIPISELSTAQSRTQPSQGNTSLSSLSSTIPGNYILSQREQEGIVNDQRKWSSLEQAWTQESLKTNQANLFENNSENQIEQQSQFNAAQLATLSNVQQNPPIASRRQTSSIPSAINIQPARTPYQAEQELEEQNIQSEQQYAEQRTSTEEQRRLALPRDYIAPNKVANWTQYTGYSDGQKDTPPFIKKASNVGKSIALISLITAMGLGAFYFLPKMFTNKQDLNKNQQDEENLGKDLDLKNPESEDPLVPMSPINESIEPDATKDQSDKSLDKTYFQEDGKTGFKPMGLPLPSKTVSSNKTSFYKSDYKSNSYKTQTSKYQSAKTNSQKTTSKNLQEYYMPKWVVMDDSSASNSKLLNDALANPSEDQGWNSYNQILPKPLVDTATTYDSSADDAIKPLAYTAQYFPLEVSYVKNNGQFEAAFTPNNVSSPNSTLTKVSQDQDLTGDEDQEYSEASSNSSIVDSDKDQAQVKQSPYSSSQINNQVPSNQKDNDPEIENLLAKPSFYKTTSSIDTLTPAEKLSPGTNSDTSNNVESDEYASEEDYNDAQTSESAPILRKPIQSSSNQIPDDASSQILPSPYNNNGVSLTTSIPGSSQSNTQNSTKISSSQFDSSSAKASNATQTNSRLSSIKQKLFGRGTYANQYKQEAVAKTADQSLNQYQTDLTELQKKATNPQNLSDQEKTQLVRDIEALKRKVSQTGQEIEEVAHTLPPEMSSSQVSTNSNPKPINNFQKENLNQLESDAAQVYSRPPFENMNGNNNNANGNSSLNIGYL